MFCFVSFLFFVLIVIFVCFLFFCFCFLIFVCFFFAFFLLFFPLHNLVSLCIAAHEVLNTGTLKVGDFVSVNVYIINLFAPLTFLGSVYNAVIQAFVDMTNLSELLSERPDVTDKPDAYDLLFRAKERFESIGAEVFRKC